MELLIKIFEKSRNLFEPSSVKLHTNAAKLIRESRQKGKGENGYCRPPFFFFEKEQKTKGDDIAIPF